MQDLGLYKNNKELMTEDDFEKTSLQTWSKSHGEVDEAGSSHLGRPRRALSGGYPEPFVLLKPPAHNTGCCVIGLTYSSGTFVSFFVCTAGCKASGPPGPFAPPLEPLEYTAESRDRTGSQHDIQCSEPAAVARGQKCGAGVKSLRTAGYA